MFYLEVPTVQFIAIRLTLYSFHTFEPFWYTDERQTGGKNTIKCLGVGPPWVSRTDSLLLNAPLPKDNPSFGVVMMLTGESVWHMAKKSQRGVQISRDLVCVKAIASHHRHTGGDQTIQCLLVRCMEAFYSSYIGHPSCKSTKHLKNTLINIMILIWTSSIIPKMTEGDNPLWEKKNEWERESEEGEGDTRQRIIESAL